MTASAPPGLYLPSEGQRVGLVWIIDHMDKRWGVILEAENPQYKFQAWELGADTGNRSGVALGTVDVEVDPSSGEWAETLSAVVGCISIGDGQTALGVQGGNRYGSSMLPVGTCLKVEGDGCAVFTRWRLTQPDYEGKPVTVYETGSTPR